jgi:RHS repeat-associated protein
MTDAAKMPAWDATWKPWGEPDSINGSVSLDTRFPGQWFQIEAGLHYNWHRHYDPTIGRYTQPDPRGFVDGPSIYSYARATPYIYVDPDGRAAQVCILSPAACAALITKTVEMCLVVAAALVAQMAGDDAEKRRCQVVLRGCKQGCTDVYVDRPWDLPGSGNNLQPRWVRCVKDCMKEHNCPY